MSGGDGVGDGNGGGNESCGDDVDTRAEAAGSAIAAAVAGTATGPALPLRPTDLPTYETDHAILEKMINRTQGDPKVARDLLVAEGVLHEDFTAEGVLGRFRHLCAEATEHLEAEQPDPGSR